MKLMRIGFLVLLAVLLPVRGAMAATMLCQPMGQDRGAASVTDHAPGHAGHGSNPASADHDHGPGPHDHGDGLHEHSPLDKCNVCSASCSSLPLPSASAGIVGPTILTSVSYPHLSAPAPTFHSDRQERPPRTL